MLRKNPHQLPKCPQVEWATIKMKLIELEQEVYDTALTTHYTPPRMELRSKKDLDKLLGLPEISKNGLAALLLAESYMVAQSQEPGNITIIWKDWDELSEPPFDVAKIAGIRTRIPWDYYGQAFNEVVDYLKINQDDITIQSGGGWPTWGWQKRINKSERFSGVSLLTIHDHYGSISPIVGKGAVYLPARSVAVVTNSIDPTTLVV